MFNIDPIKRWHVCNLVIRLSTITAFLFFVSAVKHTRDRLRPSFFQRNTTGYAVFSLSRVSGPGSAEVCCVSGVTAGVGGAAGARQQSTEHGGRGGRGELRRR